MRAPRLVVAGLSGDSGKTIVSLSLLAALRRRGREVSSFKKGPDYIDAAWMTRISGSDCRNLDTYMAEPEQVARRFASHANGIAIIEGNRGIFDGRDAEGTHSTAELARLLKAPVVLVVNCAKTTRTIAALLNGCVSFDPGLKIAGVVLNRLAGQRHERIIRDSIEKRSSVPVLGALPRMPATAEIPDRHLGLVPPSEHAPDESFDAGLAQIAEKHLDIDALVAAAAAASELDVAAGPKTVKLPPHVKVGYFRDSAFTFYYPENLEALAAAGAELEPVSSLNDKALPAIDALYIGGGFPETHAERLGANSSMMDSVREAAGKGMPIYAECGGLIYLAKSLTWKEVTHKMAGVLPIDLLIQISPAGHGYTRVTVDRENPFFDTGTVIKGHEFHYSRIVDGASTGDTCFKVERGIGIGNGRDGSLRQNTFACYTHIHADGVKNWASRLVSRAAEYKNR